MRRVIFVFCVSVMVALGCSEESSNSAPMVDAMPPPSNMDAGMTTPDSGGSDAGEVEPDAGEVPGSCSADNVLDFNAEAEEAEGQLSVSSRHGPRKDAVGSCGGDGNERVFRFAAPSAGLWTFTVSSETTNLDTVMYARTECTNTESELACNDDRIPNQALVSEIRLTLEADQAVFVFVDMFSGDGNEFTLTARQVPAVGFGEACDSAVRLAGCPSDGFCRVPADSETGMGICVPNEAPQISEVSVFRAGDWLGIQVTGTDSGGDVTRGLLQLYQGEQRIVLNEENGADTLIMTPILSLFGEENFQLLYRASGFSQWSQANAVQVALEDSQGNRADFTRAAIVEAPVAMDQCDQYRIVDSCPEGLACLDPDGDEQFSCVEIAPPTITRAKGYYNAESLLIGFEVSGSDPDNDVSALFLELLDAEGMRVASGNIPFQQVQSEDGQYSAQLSFRLAQDFGFSSTRIQVIDAEGLASEPRDLPGLLDPREAEEGDPCDPLRARAFCVDGFYCFSPSEEEAPVCGTPDVACPDAWGELLTIEGAGPEWRIDGDLTGLPNRTFGSCGGGASQAIYTFTAPATSAYSFLANSGVGGADPVLYVRSHCGFDGDYPDLELGCNDNQSDRTRAALVRAEIEAGQTVYVFVDGADGQNGPWRGPFELVVRQLP